jgi:hypothetical protein
LYYIDSVVEYKDDFIMAKLKVYKRTSQFLDLADLAGEISSLGLVEGLQKYYNLLLKRKLKV